MWRTQWRPRLDLSPQSPIISLVWSQMLHRKTVRPTKQTCWKPTCSQQRVATIRAVGYHPVQRMSSNNLSSSKRAMLKTIIYSCQQWRKWQINAQLILLIRMKLLESARFSDDGFLGQQMDTMIMPVMYHKFAAFIIYSTVLISMETSVGCRLILKERGRGWSWFHVTATRLI